jgi:hypothetical protein
MKTEWWGNDADGQFQGLTASKFLPQLPQDAFLLCGWYAETPPETNAGSSNEPGGFQVGVEGGWAGGLRRDFEFASDLGFWILADV